MCYVGNSLLPKRGEKKKQQEVSCSAPLAVIEKQKNARPYRRRQLQRHSTRAHCWSFYGSAVVLVHCTRTWWYMSLSVDPLMAVATISSWPPTVRYCRCVGDRIDVVVYTHTPLYRMVRFHEFRTGQWGIRDNRSGFSAGEFRIHRNSYGLARYPGYRDPG